MGNVGFFGFSPRHDRQAGPAYVRKRRVLVGSDVQAVDFAGLDFERNIYECWFSVKRGAAASAIACSVQMFYDDDSTITNYNYRSLNVVATPTSASGNNGIILLGVATAGTMFSGCFQTWKDLETGTVRTWCWTSWDTNTNSNWRGYMQRWNTVANPTKATFGTYNSASGAAVVGIGTGSLFKLFEISDR